MRFHKGKIKLIKFSWENLNFDVISLTDKRGSMKKIFVLMMAMIMGGAYCARAQEQVYDAVIVGAGIAGITAAAQLQGYNILVLEKESYAGGRILTGKKNGIIYELGLSFGYDPKTLLPYDYKADAAMPPFKVGISYEGQNIYCDGETAECLVQSRLPKKDVKEMIKFSNTPLPDEGLIPKVFSGKKYKIMNSLFNVIHVGELSEYIPQRQQDAFMRWPVHARHPAGSSTIIEQFKKPIADSLQLNAEVIEVKDRGDYVETKYSQNGKIKNARSKTVIVTTPAPITKKIVAAINPLTKEYLDTVRYGKFIVVAVGFDSSVSFDDCQFWVTPDEKTSAIGTQKFRDKKASLMLAYYTDKESGKLEKYSDAKIIKKTLRSLRKLNIGKFSKKNVLFSDVKRWKFGGTIINPELFGDFGNEYWRASRNVFLAGDYLYRDYLCPYGLGAAMKSGQRAAMGIMKFLGK